jgi:methylated-DNA-protein-cysteine methyltransferase related protein
VFCYTSLMSAFSQIVYELALSIPEGTVVTYGDLARAAGGGAMASRSISSILGKAPNQKAIPWHRIVYAGGKVWLSPENEKRRRALYRREGIVVTETGSITNFEDIHHIFD